MHDLGVAKQDIDRRLAPSYSMETRPPDVANRLRHGRERLDGSCRHRDHSLRSLILAQLIRRVMEASHEEPLLSGSHQTHHPDHDHQGLRLLSARVRHLAGANTQGNHMVSSSPITRFKSIACARSGKNRRERTRK